MHETIGILRYKEKSLPQRYACTYIGSIMGTSNPCQLALSVSVVYVGNGVLHTRHLLTREMATSPFSLSIGAPSRLANQKLWSEL